jgi:hypothetical protein
MRIREIDGKLYPSVTTVLSATDSRFKKEALEKWKNEQLAQGLDPNEASSDGTKLHELLEYYLKNDYEFPDTKDYTVKAVRMFERYNRRFLKSNYIKPIGIEQFYKVELANGLRYCGTIDLIAYVQSESTIPAKLEVIDHKSIGVMSKASSRMANNKLQIAAYAKLLKENGIVVEGARVNFVSHEKTVAAPKDEFKSYLFTPEEIAENFAKFEERLIQFYDEGYMNEVI